MPANATAPSPRPAPINACRRENLVIILSPLGILLESVSELVRIRQCVYHIHESRGPGGAQLFRLGKSSGGGNRLAGRLLPSDRLFLSVQERFECVLLPRLRRA